MANELAVEYVSIVPTGVGIGPAIRRILTGNQVKQAAAAGGVVAGKGISDGVTKSSSHAGRALALGLGGGAALAAVGLKKAVDKAGAFQHTMIQVGTQVGASGAQMKGLTDLAVEMGAKTVFSAQDASEAMLELAKGGLTQAEIKGGALQETLTLATAGGLKLGDASTFVANGMAAFGLEAKDAAQVTTAFAGAANASTASVESIGFGMAQVGPIAHLMGLSIQDSTAALAAFDSAGLKGQDAGTSLKTMLTRLIPSTDATTNAFERLGLLTVDAASATRFLQSKGIKPLGSDVDTLTGQMQKYAMKVVGATTFNGKARKEFNRLGMETGAVRNAFFDATGQVKSLSSVSQTLQNALKGQSKEQKLATLNTLFGSDASRAAAILADQGAKGLAKYVRAVNSKSGAEKLAAAATAGYSGAMEAFKGGLDTVQIQLGTLFLPLLTKLLKFGANSILPLFSKFLTWVGPRLSGAFSRLGKTVHNFMLGFRSNRSLESFGGHLDTAGKAGVVLRTVFSKVKDVLGAIDWKGIGDALKGAFGSVLDAAKGIDWSSFAGNISSVGKGLSGLDLGGLSSVGKGFGDVLGFIADHMGLIQKAIPYIVAGFVAFKVAQAANSVIGRDSLIGFAAQLATTITLTASNYLLARSYDGVRGEQKKVAKASGVTTLGYVRQTAAAVAHKVATIAGAVATKALAVAQRVLNVVMRANPIGLIVTALILLVGGLIYAYKHSETFRKIVNAAFHGVAKVAKAVFDWLSKAVGAVIGFIRRHWQLLVGILGGPLAAGVILIVKHWGSIKHAFSAAKDWVVGAFKSAWGLAKRILVDPVLGARDRIRDLLASVRERLSAVKDWAVGVFKRAWSAVKATITNPISSARSAISKILGAERGGLRYIFRAAVSAVGRIWDGLKRIAKAPIRFVVNTVLENGILKAFRKIAGLIGLGSLAEKMHVSLPPGFAGGGFTGAGGKHEPAGIVHKGEMVFEQDRVRQLGVAELESLRKGRARIVPGYAGGGLVGGIKDVFSFMAHPKDALRKILDKLLGGGKALLDSSLGKIVRAIPGRLLSGLVEKLKAGFGGAGGPMAPGGGPLPGGGAVTRWAPIATTVLQMLNQPLGSLAGLLRRIQLESGGNPRAINLWDSNAKAGHPSMGLMQTIQGTFDAFAGPFRGRGIWDPLANIYAGSAYAVSRYGSVQAIDPLVHPGGYAAGTMAARPGLAWVGEHGPELVRFQGGEGVVSNDDLQRLLRRPGLHVDKIDAFDVRDLIRQLEAMVHRRDVLGATAGPGG